ncbi:MAG: phenylalanine--tRNA ligase subunit beta [Kofleriaceae bacterium]|jgi:phenylalanyl-tRNA synthetase beta chain|nr:phenylalanine--tRNA ligase subunit beta [Kofleriaceae bacterium]MBP9861166.1 phenylalanine--tRNA ligase subunit beta [Kofleriaceae bacterium]
MKALWSWLLELCDLPKVPTVDEGIAALTGGGLEIEGATDLGAGFSGVVVAQVVAKRPHPQSQKLTLVDVITERDGAATQVVCGAPNVPEPGRKVLWARPGATLPGGITLGIKPVKGVESPGMLCAEDELGLGDDHDGIIVLAADDPTALGAPAQRALGVDDWLFDVNVPANRGDCLGHEGLARELAALLGGRLVQRDYTAELAELASPLSTAELVALAIDDPIGCPRYVARIIDGVTVGPSPRRFAQRLRAVGVRPISNLVDVTNYVLFELGQPLHAFDWHRLAAPPVVGVRRARAGERLTTLDGQDRGLVEGDLVITDASGPIALAGVMGGQATEVSAATTRILLESASFEARSIRRTARRTGLLSEASQRFERGVDPALAARAAAQAAVLLARLGGGTIAHGEVDHDRRPATRPAVPLRLARAQALTGAPLSAASVEDALARLGCAATADGDGRWLVTPPSARADLTREVDVIEDVLRVVGYGSVPATLPALSAAPHALVRATADRVRHALAGAGLAEAITFGFQAAARIEHLGLPADDRRAQPIAVRNPMSIDQAVMRTSLLPNLIAAIARNHSFGVTDVALFEVGAVFLRAAGQPPTGEPTALADEPTQAAVVLAGSRPRRFAAPEPWDVFDAKGYALAALAALGVRDVAVTAAEDIPYLHPGVAARILHRGIAIGCVGELHPDVRARFGVEVPVLVAELDLSLVDVPGPVHMRPVPRFPASARDVSLLLPEAVPAADVEQVIAGAHEPLIERVALAEEYRDVDKLGADKKSQLWSITYRAPDRTLTVAEIDAAHEAIVARLTAALPAARR